MAYSVILLPLFGQGDGCLCHTSLCPGYSAHILCCIIQYLSVNINPSSGRYVLQTLLDGWAAASSQSQLCFSQGVLHSWGQEATLGRRSYLWRSLLPSSPQGCERLFKFSSTASILRHTFKELYIPYLCELTVSAALIQRKQQGANQTHDLTVLRPMRNGGQAVRTFYEETVPGMSFCMQILRCMQGLSYCYCHHCHHRSRAASAWACTQSHTGAGHLHLVNVFLRSHTIGARAVRLDFESLLSFVWL